MKMDFEQLWQSLARCRIQTAIGMLGPWVAGCALPGEVELLLDACPKRLRGHLALLLDDLLSGWPRAIVGVPVLLWCAHSEDSEPAERRAVLPGAGAQCSPPCPELRFLGWLDKSSLLPTAGVQAGRLADVEVGVCGSAVALFHVADGFDVDDVLGSELIRPVWWGELLNELQGSVYISVGVVQSYPVALEVARTMERAAGGKVAAPGVFSTHLELEAGAEAGKAFPGRAAAALGACGSRRAGADDDELI